MVEIAIKYRIGLVTLFGLPTLGLSCQLLIIINIFMYIFHSISCDMEYFSSLSPIVLSYTLIIKESLSSFFFFFFFGVEMKLQHKKKIK